MEVETAEVEGGPARAGVCCCCCCCCAVVVVVLDLNPKVLKFG